MLQRWILPVLVLFLLALSACGEAAAEMPPEGEGTSETAPAEQAALLRSDAEGLVSVRIINGRAEMIYHMTNWEALHGVSDIAPGPFAVVTMGEIVADACIGKVEVLDLCAHEHFITPTVMLLMADGTVEYLLADPYEDRMDETMFSFGTIPWLSDIQALSYEESGEGIGGKSFYALGRDGVQRDAALAAQFRFLQSGEWITELTPYSEESGYLGALRFIDETQVQFDVKSFYEVSESYVGSYRLVLTDGAEESEGYGSGQLILDLGLDWTSAEGVEGEADEGFPRRTIQGAYFAELTKEPTLRLWLAEGDALYRNRQADPLAAYEFTLFQQAEFSPYG